MSEQFGSQPRDIYAAIGPSIGACCYEVSEEVQQLFQGRQQFHDMPTAEKYRNLVRESAVFIRKQDSEQARPHLDLWETNRNQLLRAGLLLEHIELPGICTSCEKERFFSHRGEYGRTGRFPSILALRNI
jgi:copper oxidase (laccase) domain-containing protein